MQCFDVCVCLSDDKEGKRRVTERGLFVECLIHELQASLALSKLMNLESNLCCLEVIKLM